MKRTLCTVGWAGLVAVGCTADGPAQTSDVDAIRGVIEAVAAYSQARNLDAIDTLFAPEDGIHIIEGAGVNHGWADYRDNHSAGIWSAKVGGPQCWKGETVVG